MSPEVGKQKVLAAFHYRGGRSAWGTILLRRKMARQNHGWATGMYRPLIMRQGEEPVAQLLHAEASHPLHRLDEPTSMYKARVGIEYRLRRVPLLERNRHPPREHGQ
jgi:hypothetical protein